MTATTVPSAPPVPSAERPSVPSRFARAGAAFHDENLAAFSSWPAPGVSPAGYFRAPLGPDAVGFYRENGFLVLQDALTPQELAALNTDAAKICRGTTATSTA